MLNEMDIPWLGEASRRARWLVGVSGGADSVALLHLLVEAGFRRLVVCHLDHRLRGRASAGDARFVRSLAAGLGLTHEIGRADVRARMKERREAMETAARGARHRFFEECAVKHRCRRLLLAHHADDQAETVLWNLLRGSHGLKGMRQEHVIRVEGGGALRIFRPLLGVRHADLVGWLQARGLSWREDASNAEALAVRNRLRHEVFPLLAEITGRDPVAAFARGAADGALREDAEREMLARAMVLDPQGRLHLPALRELPPALQRVALADFLASHGIAAIDRALVKSAVSMTDPSHAAAINLPGGCRLRRRAGRLWIEGRTS
jgi:tRNA(Ile)-lysidine synthase